VSEYREQFWKNLERAYADYDNAQFDLARQTEADTRADQKNRRWTRILLAIIVLLSTLVVIQLEQMRKEHGPSHNDRVQLQRLIDAAN
jgi:hypothetical protein